MVLQRVIRHGVLGGGAGGMTVVDSLTEFLDPITLYTQQLEQAGHKAQADEIRRITSNKEEMEQQLKEVLLGLGIIPSELKVDLIEAAPRLGGHVESLTYSDNPFHSELGPEFIHDAYVLLINRLKRHGIKLTPFTQSFTIFNKATGTHDTIPPIHATKKTGCALSCSSADDTQPNLTLDIDSLTEHWTDLLGLGQLLLDAHCLQAHPKQVMTLEQFAENFCKETSALPQSTRRLFVSNVLFPLVASSWGITVTQAKSMCAHYALTYLALGMNWNEVAGGLEQSIQKVRDDAVTKPNMSITNNTKVTSLIPIKGADGVLNYKVEEQLADGSIKVRDAVYDSISLGMNLKDLIPVLSKLAEQDSEVAEVIEACKKVTYYHTKVVFHRDPKYIPPQHTVVNIHYDGEERAATTIFKDFHAKKNRDGSYDYSSVVMKSWVFPESPEPENQLGHKEFEHPLMDLNYYEAVWALKNLEERRPDLKIKLVSISGGYNDANESAVYKGTVSSANVLVSNGLPLTRVLKENQDPNSLDTGVYDAKKSDQWLTAIKPTVTVTPSNRADKTQQRLARRANAFFPQQTNHHDDNQAEKENSVNPKKSESPSCCAVA